LAAARRKVQLLLKAKDRCDANPRSRREQRAKGRLVIFGYIGMGTLWTFEALLKKGWVQPSKSPFAANLVFVRKKDGSLRMCVDFRLVNQATKKVAAALPRFENVVALLSGATHFTTLDLASFYHQVLLHPDSRSQRVTWSGVASWPSRVL
jgi:hypothetical protein